MAEANIPEDCFLQPPSPKLRSNSSGSWDSDGPPVPQGHLDVVVRRSLTRTSSELVSGMPVYEMIQRPRGRALIIEIEKYDNDVQERRIGSDIDVNNLSKLLKALYFEVDIRQNLTRIEFLNELQDFSEDPCQLQADMMVLVVLSHGRDGHIYTSDGLVVATEVIYEKFNNQMCPSLKGKPKFFIIQACRGDETDTGSEQSSTTNTSLSYDAAPMTATDCFGQIHRARPTWEDMIIAYSTIPGFASIRDPDKGTWFIQSLVEVFMDHAYNRELIDLLRMTSERLSKFTNEQGEKQTCNIELRHLYKRIYFNPGLPQSVQNSPQSLRRSKSTPQASPKRNPSQM